MTLAVALRRSPIGGNLPTFVASEWADSANGGVGQIAIPKPAGTVEGDLMIAAVSIVDSGAVFVPTGWTKVADNGADETVLAIAYKIAGASEGSSYTFTNLGGPQEMGGYIQTWRNAEFDVVGAFYGGNNADVVMPSISPTGSAILLAFVASQTAGIGFSTPSGMTLREADNTYQPSMASFYQTVSAGATGSRTSTADNSPNRHRGILAAIKGA